MTIVTWTRIEVGLAGGPTPPYVLAIAETDTGTRVLGRLGDDLPRPAVGARVRMSSPSDSETAVFVQDEEHPPASA